MIVENNNLIQKKSTQSTQSSQINQISNEEREQLLLIAEEFEKEQEQNLQRNLKLRLEEKQMEQFQYKDAFFNYNHSDIDDYLKLQEEYIGPWQVNFERVQHGQDFGVKVPSMTSLVKGLMDQWEVEQKGR
ncbi:unnamed protein product [Paramecium pentaurelia]|uniref:Uncharacterized protein n=1 Tax=Paramecium pentaurelia TaxID=43138 RepID=A0A8S1WXD0_9CILI|nr:unnamed protein product [Paramecium pentaurelia]